MAKFDGVLFVSDMDGTLLDSGHEISRENADAIRYFTGNGGTFTVATGRMVRTIAQYVTQINANAPIISINGAAIYDLARGKLLHSTPLDTDIVKIVEKLATEFPELGIEAITMEKLYICRESHVTRRHCEIVKMPHELTDIREVIGECMKLNLMHDPGYLDRVEQFVGARYPDEFYMVHSDPQYLEVLHKGVNKGLGLRIIADIKHIAKENTCAIGDNYNDIELLKNAALSFAPANAEQQLKDIADVVVSTNDDNAVCQAITYIDKQGIFRQQTPQHPQGALMP